MSEENLSIYSNESANKPTNLTERPISFGFFILAGIILPIITLSVELWTKMCAEEFFDPIPTLWHVLLVGFVPVANIQLIWALYKKRFERITLLGWMSAIAMGISVVYSIFFLPLLPISFLAILFLGIGFLPLSPMIALWATYKLRKYLLNSVETKIFPLRWSGLITSVFIVLTVFAITESRFVVSRIGLEMAISENVERQDRGINLLRKFGDDDYLLQIASSRRRNLNFTDFVSNMILNNKISSSQKAQEVYYRQTGKTYDSQAVPTLFSWGDSENRFWQEKDISLIASQMDGSIDNDASLGYLEWTVTFRNRNEFRALEGFTQIQLPPNAVVSRLTLWINGEEREAAFAERAKVTNAYEEVTAKKRDPVLVTTAGRDRVNMKFFPILPNGGEMKMRLGITFPLILEDEKNGLIRLPYFRDKNFQIPDEIKHIVWLESKRELQSANQNLKLEAKENIFTVRGNIADNELLDPNSSIKAVKSDDFEAVWTKEENNYITQEIREVSGAKPSRFIFVVDTSETMKNEQTKIADSIKTLPAETEVGIVLTHGNSLNQGFSYPNSFVGNPAEIAEIINNAIFAGGTDNLPSLTKAWDLANEKENSVVIWVHAPQPYKFSNSLVLVQRLNRRPNQTELFTISTANGFDVVEKELDKLSYLQNTPRFGGLKTDLDRLLAKLNQSQKSFSYQRVNIAKAEFTNAKETSKHLLRLWANDEINRILASEKDEKKAVELGMKYQLVTPVTGAVVLETQQQYDEFGLKPVDKETVPTIPEPETYVLIAVVLGVLLWLLVTRRFF